MINPIKIFFISDPKQVPQTYNANTNNKLVLKKIGCAAANPLLLCGNPLYCSTIGQLTGNFEFDLFFLHKQIQ